MRLLLALLTLATLWSPRTGAAAELVMFESTLCEWCEIWNHDVGGVYAKTEEGVRAPLRRVDMDEPRPKSLRHIRGVIYTPTFVLLDGDREVGRITGYPGESHFWGLLGEMLERLPAPVQGCLQPQKTAMRPATTSTGGPAC